MKRVQPRKKLRLECLEPRNMLAGNVTASLNGGGTLRIRGDDLGNGISVIADTATPGEFRVEGDATTTINGAALGVPAMFTGVVHIEIDMKKGNDDVIMYDETSHATTLAGNLSIKLADGIDTLTIGDLDDDEFTVGGNVTIQAGKGDDVIRVDELNVAGDTQIDTSDGMDSVTIDNTLAAGTKSATQFEGDLEISLGLHNDSVTLVGVAVDEDLEIGTSKGDDEVELTNVTVAGSAEIETSDGIDRVEVNSTGIVTSLASPSTSSFVDLDIALGHGNDTLLMRGTTSVVTVAGDLEIGTSLGDDEAHLIFVTVIGSTNIRTSDGIDCVEIRSSIFARFDLNLGHGDDHLLVGGTMFGGPTDLNGSAGFDTFYDALGNTPPVLTPLLRGFEDLLGVLADFPCLLV